VGDPFQLREDSAVAWLAFKRQLGSLLTPLNEESFRLAFKQGFCDGYGKGLRDAFATSKAIVDKACSAGEVQG